MPRIRSVKPEFFNSPSTARASAVARLAFIGMWNWADDFGRGTANLKELEGFIFPNDDVAELSSGKSRSFRDVVAEVSDCYGVVFYEVSGRPYYAIPTWEKHQRNEKRAQSKYPGPDEADRPLTRDNASSSGESRKFRDSVSENLGSSVTGTGEQGNSLKDLSKPHGSDDTKIVRSDKDQEFNAWYFAYPRKEAKESARKAFIKARRTTPLETLMAGVESYARTAQGKDRQFIALPATWLNGRRWEDETETQDDTLPHYWRPAPDVIL